MSKIERGWTGKTILRYSLLQLPDIFILAAVSWITLQFVEIPVWLIWAVICAWIIKDIVLFPFVWNAYDTWDGNNFAVLSGKKGVIVNKPDPVGTVLINGEFWQARAERPGMILEKGTPVRVVNRNDMILTIAEDSKNSNHQQSGTS